MPQAGSWTVSRGSGSITVTMASISARREILPSTRLDLLRVAFEKALIDRAFDIDAEPEPGLAVDKADKTPQLGRVLDPVLRLEKNCSDNAGAARKLFENRRMAPRQLFRLQIAQYRPAAT